MDPELKKLLDEMKASFEELKKGGAERDEQLKGTSGVAAEAKEKIDKINDTMDELDKKMEKLETQIKRKNTGAEQKNELSQEEKDYKSAINTLVMTGEKSSNIRELHQKAFKAALERVQKTKNFGDTELKALSVDTDPSGGYYVMPDTTGRVVERIFESSPVRALASVQTITTDRLEGFYDDDEASAGWVGEKQARPETDTPEIGKWEIPVHEQYAMPKVTQKLIDDASFNPETWLEDKVSKKFSRLEATAFVTGNGSLKPRGFLTYAAASDADVYERDAIGQYTSASSGVVVFEDLINVQERLKPEYSNNAVWALNRKSIRNLRLIKDTYDRFVWQPGVVAGQPQMLLGEEIVPMNDIPVITNSALAIAYGDFGEAYQIVDRMGISVLRDPFTNKPSVLLYCRRRVGGAVIRFDALKILKVKS